MSSVPGNSGLISINYAKIHPIDQISIEGPYYIEPNKTYGALYHKVTMP